MDKMFINVVDQDVAVYCVYASDGDAFVDEACTKAMTTSELKQAFIVGAVIVADGVMYKPVSMEIASGVATVSYIVPNDTTATSADIATVESVADPA